MPDEQDGSKRATTHGDGGAGYESGGGTGGNGSEGEPDLHAHEEPSSPGKSTNDALSKDETNNDDEPYSDEERFSESDISLVDSEDRLDDSLTASYSADNSGIRTDEHSPDRKPDPGEKADVESSHSEEKKSERKRKRPAGDGGWGGPAEGGESEWSADSLVASLSRDERTRLHEFRDKVTQEYSQWGSAYFMEVLIECERDLEIPLTEDDVPNGPGRRTLDRWIELLEDMQQNPDRRALHVLMLSAVTDRIRVFKESTSQMDDEG